MNHLNHSLSDLSCKPSRGPDAKAGETSALVYQFSVVMLLLLLLVQEAVESGPVVPMFCDNPVAEKAASNAVHKFNEKLSTGYKLALFQIHKSIKVQRRSDVHLLHIQLLFKLKKKDELFTFTAHTKTALTLTYNALHEEKGERNGEYKKKKVHFYLKCSVVSLKTKFCQCCVKDSDVNRSDVVDAFFKSPHGSFQS